MARGKAKGKGRARQTAAGGWQGGAASSKAAPAHADTEVNAAHPHADTEPAAAHADTARAPVDEMIEEREDAAGLPFETTDTGRGLAPAEVKLAFLRAEIQETAMVLSGDHASAREDDTGDVTEAQPIAPSPGSRPGPVQPAARPKGRAWVTPCALVIGAAVGYVLHLVSC